MNPNYPPPGASSSSALIGIGTEASSSNPPGQQQQIAPSTGHTSGYCAYAASMIQPPPQSLGAHIIAQPQQVTELNEWTRTLAHVKGLLTSGYKHLKPFAREQLDNLVTDVLANTNTIESKKRAFGRLTFLLEQWQFIEQLQQTVKEQRQRNANQAKQLTEQGKRIQNLEAQNRNMEAQNRNMEAQNRNMEANIGNLHAQVKFLMAEVEQLRQSSRRTEAVQQKFVPTTYAHPSGAAAFSSTGTGIRYQLPLGQNEPPQRAEFQLHAAGPVQQQCVPTTTAHPSGAAAFSSTGTGIRYQLPLGQNEPPQRAEFQQQSRQDMHHHRQYRYLPYTTKSNEARMQQTKRQDDYRRPYY